MLVLTRKMDEAVILSGRDGVELPGGSIRVVVVEVKGDRVRLGFDADSWIAVDRQEVHEAKRADAARLSANNPPEVSSQEQAA